ncbi:MAG TPA: hypothetical protein VI875_03840 [Candidatus Norongarragalinales archaeon]|nr:hypothetical protein [Candidatus Norongarragalinales archaeon]
MGWLISKKDFEGNDERKLEPLFKEAVGYGAVLSIMHFDAHSKEANAVKDSLVDFLARLTKEEGVLYCRGEIEEVVGSESEGFSSNAEVKILTDSFPTLLRLTMRYGPVALEILEPRELKLDIPSMQDLLLSASEISKQYASYVVEKVWGKEELEKYRERITRQMQEGRKLREKAEEKK